MRNFFFLACAACALCFAACQSKGIKTEHGFRFVNHTDNGGIKPQPGETVMLHYSVYIGDSLMNTSRTTGAPREYSLMTKDALPKRVPAIYDAVLLMGEGDSASVYETIDTFLQKFIPPGLKDAKEVRYELVLADVITQAEKDKAKAEAESQLKAVEEKVANTVKAYAGGSLGSQLTTTASGLKVLIEDKGSGPAVKVGENVKVHYYGALKDGKPFDNSYQRGERYGFPAGVGQMIKGFDEGVMMLNHGGKAFFFIPSNLGYGDQESGPIPANSELIFYVDVQ